MHRSPGSIRTRLCRMRVRVMAGFQRVLCAFRGKFCSTTYVRRRLRSPPLCFRSQRMEARLSAAHVMKLSCFGGDESSCVTWGQVQRELQEQEQLKKQVPFGNDKEETKGKRG